MLNVVENKLWVRVKAMVTGRTDEDPDFVVDNQTPSPEEGFGILGESGSAVIQSSI